MRYMAKQVSTGLALALAGPVVVLALLCLAPSAQAAYEQLPEPDGIFGGSTTPIAEGEKFPEEVQLGGTGSLAVNRTGAGGVPKGTLYAVTEVQGGGDPSHVAMYEPTGSGGFKFVTSWEVKDEEPYERCGPLLGTEEVGGKTVADHPCPARPTGGSEPAVGIGIDQTTGNVIVYDQGLHVDGIVSYSADGSEVVTRFGEVAEPRSQTVEESPEKTHSAFSPDPLAVNPAGEVFLYDEVALGGVHYRLMVFRPHEGNVADYEYAGEIAEGTNVNHRARAPVFDEAGNLYVASIGSGTNFVEALAPEEPGPYPTLASTPRCSSKFKGGGGLSMTVDPATGEPFLFSEKKSTIFHLGACDESTHEFAAAAAPEEIALDPTPEYLYALAFDPARKTGENRPRGALYAATAGPNLEETANLGEPETHSGLGYVFAHQVAAVPPQVEAEAISAVTATDARASATINPNGYRTTYVFQYLTEAAWKAAGESFAGATEAPLGGGAIEPGGGARSVSVALGPLSPDTAYRFRIVASSECNGPGEPACVVPGEAVFFHTFAAVVPTLPDDRAWELVSPAQKNGGQVIPADPFQGLYSKPGQVAQTMPMQSAPDGEAVTYEGTAFGEGGAKRENQYLAHRDASGWTTVALSLPLASRAPYKKGGFTPGLGTAFFGQLDEDSPLAPEAPTGYADLYAQSTPEPSSLTPLVTAPPPHRSGKEFELRYAAASADGSRVFFSANDSLTEATAYVPAPEDGGASKSNLYEWHAGRLSLVNVLPGYETKAGASFGAQSANTVSEDGSHAFFSTEGGQVYVRIDGRETRRIEDGGKFLSASSDGSKAILSDGCLYSLAGESCLDLTEGEGAFQGVVGQSRDLGHVYFVDTAVLPAAAGQSACRPTQTGEQLCEEPGAGQDNLYSWKEGGQARFVATLGPRDNENQGLGGGMADWKPVPAERTAEASPDGRYLAFLSAQQLTGYGNVGPCESDNAGGTKPQACPEVFLYDSQAGQLVCASCNPTGAAPLGYSVLRRIKAGEAFPQPRYLTDEGRLFFDSQDSLSLADTNEGGEDVYEWEPGGIGTCARAGGCVTLISGGREATDSNLVGINEGGEGAAAGQDVFFTTRDRLVPADKDELFDLYDAREAGGFASETETTRPECQGEACQPSPSPPAETTPASAAFHGAGNLQEGQSTAPRCPKGKRKVKSRGKTRCVAKHKRHHRKHKRHHRRKHRGANADRRAHR